MLSEPVLVDTGPLVAIYSADDAHHAACVSQLDLLPVSKAYTCWPVLTEAVYMLRHKPAQRDDLFQSVINGDLVLLPLGEDDLIEVRQCLRTYSDQQIDLADACLLHLANREKISTVFTLDRRHFSVFRTKSGQALNLLPVQL
jgi:predicted nucleic acid-binding protein